jgi:hypothetical protein
VPQQLEGLPEMKPEDQQYFGKLLKVCGYCWYCKVVPVLQGGDASNRHCCSALSTR